MYFKPMGFWQWPLKIICYLSWDWWCLWCHMKENRISPMMCIRYICKKILDHGDINPQTWVLFFLGHCTHADPTVLLFLHVCNVRVEYCFFIGLEWLHDKTMHVTLPVVRRMSQRSACAMIITHTQVYIKFEPTIFGKNCPFFPVFISFGNFC
jgi:hypothetical protein